jgi:hypothetical protein
VKKKMPKKPSSFRRAVAKIKVKDGDTNLEV